MIHSPPASWSVPIPAWPPVAMTLYLCRFLRCQDTCVQVVGFEEYNTKRAQFWSTHIRGLWRPPSWHKCAEIGAQIPATLCACIEAPKQPGES
ncbi:hypothetical protein BKA80DRAFT_9663 [Phyllosticta citrichinensis]